MVRKLAILAVTILIFFFLVGQPGFIFSTSESITWAQGIINVTRVSLDRNNITLRVGQSATLTATVDPQNATDKSITWASSAMGTVDVRATGPTTASISALSGGTTTITVTTVDGGKTATCDVNVIIPVRSLSLDQTALNIGPNEEVVLTVKIVPTDATNQDLIWSSTEAGVASVVPIDPARTTSPNPQARVKTHKEGEARIIARSVDDNSITVFCVVNVSVSAPISDDQVEPPIEIADEYEQDLVPVDQTEPIVTNDKESSYPYILIGVFIFLALAGFLIVKNQKAKALANRAPLVGIKGKFAGQSFKFNKGQLVIGRDPALSQVSYPETEGSISRKHCTVSYDQATNTYVLIDSSSNGTYLASGEKLVSGKPYILKTGDRFYLANPNELFEIGKQ